MEKIMKAVAVAAPVTMKLSKRTLDILKNFSVINPSLYVENGNKLYTISNSMTVIAEAKIEETFGSKFSIYELTRFLGVVSLFNSPEFEFEDNCVNIFGQTGSKVKYHFCQNTLLDKLVKNYGRTPKDNMDMYSFDITSKQIDELTRAASVLSLNNLKRCKSEQGGVDVSVFDREKATDNAYTINIQNGTVSDDDAEPCFMKINLLNLLPGDYTVEFGQGPSTRWTNKTANILYYIVKEANKE